MPNSASGVVVGFDQRTRERPLRLQRWGKLGPHPKLHIFEVTLHDACILNVLKSLIRALVKFGEIYTQQVDVTSNALKGK